MKQIFTIFCLAALAVSACQNPVPQAPTLQPSAQVSNPMTTPAVIHATSAATSTAVPANASVIQLGHPFTLAVGEHAVLPEGDLHLRFEHMLEDSRCPRSVLCIWSGQARAAISIWSEETAPQTLEFSTFSKPPVTTDSHSIDRLIITLKRVDPYPQSPDVPIPEMDYRLTLVVTRV
jgi:hypothetical protein